MKNIADNITIANRQNFKPTTTHDDSDSKARDVTTPFHNKESEYENPCNLHYFRVFTELPSRQAASKFGQAR